MINPGQPSSTTNQIPNLVVKDEVQKQEEDTLSQIQVQNSGAVTGFVTSLQTVLQNESIRDVLFNASPWLIETADKIIDLQSRNGQEELLKNTIDDFVRTYKQLRKTFSRKSYLFELDELDDSILKYLKTFV